MLFLFCHFKVKIHLCLKVKSSVCVCVCVCRYALQDMDKFSLKDSGRGDSDAGDSDCETGRDSPIDRLLGDGFGELFHIDAQNRLHPGTQTNT